MTVNFTGVTTGLMAEGDKNYVIKDRNKIEIRQRQRARQFMIDYQRWKLAFSI